MSEKYRAALSRSVGVSLMRALLPERGLRAAVWNLGGADILSGSVEKVNAELNSCATICFWSKIIFTKQQYLSHSCP